ncbi:MAG: site-specific DNA-methyltransferase [Chlorobi bacterium]|nr:site-specific DNA-methyltransferase [Chlorobiota bacterium]
MTLSAIKDNKYNETSNLSGNYLKKLKKLLESELDFHNFSSNYGAHNFHSFPAKFPPQLPKKFIEELTEINEVVLDPMAGSGTTVLEAMINNRTAIGFDIDPLSLMIMEVKTSNYSKKELVDSFNEIISKSTSLLMKGQDLYKELFYKLDTKTEDFIKYWFLESTTKELFALSKSILTIKNEKIRRFFKVIFSSIIITKSGGVSLALDLAHTRPHRAKKVFDFNSDLVFDFGKYKENPRHHILSKKIKSPLNEFRKKFFQNIQLIFTENMKNKPRIEYADSQNLPLSENVIDLIVTSPPYASNAIDYMRAHKFSLLWFDYTVDNLKDQRAKYIGSDSTSNFLFEKMPPFTEDIIQNLYEKNPKKSLVLHRYYSEMKRVLKEFLRVLKPNKAAIVVVGNSTLSGVKSETHLCLKEIGEEIGFQIPGIAIRKLDRNRRMMPAVLQKNNSSQILQRMNEEYVIGFYKH